MAGIQFGLQTGYNAPITQVKNKFPGFSEEDIKKLEEKTKDIVDPIEKAKIQNEIYRKVLPIVQQQKQLQARDEGLNELSYQAEQEKNQQKKSVINVGVKMGELGNAIKTKFNLPANAPDDEIIKQFIDQTRNGEQMLVDYINGKSEELLYVSGLKDRPMTLGDTEGRNPLLRAGGALLQGVAGTIKGAYEGLVPGFGEMVSDIRKITRDQTKSLPEKFNQILFGEIGMDYIGGAIGDTFGGALEGLYKGFATESERKLVNEKVKGIMEGIVKKEPVQNIMKKYNKLNPQEQQELNDLIGYAGNAMNFVGIGLGAKPAVQGAKAAGKVGIETLEQTAKLAPKMPGVSLKKLLPSAENTLQRMNRLTKGEQEKFKTMVGKEVGQWLNERGVVGTPGETIMELGERFSNTKGQVDEGLNAIRGTYKTEPLDLMLDDSVRYAENTRNPKLSRLQELQNKNSQGGLEMSEINEVKRFFEQNNKFNYGRDITAGEKTAWATNVDNELRNRQIDIAEKNGFANLKELNKETQAAKFIMDKLAKNESGRLGNNAITITDWIVAAPAMVDPSFLTLLLGKKIANSNWFAKNYVKIANRINGHKNIADKVADLVEIKKVQNEKQLQEFLNTPALPYKEGVDGGGNIDLNTIMVTPEGKSVRKGQILETNLNTNATSNMNDNINISNTKVLGKKVNPQSETIPQLKAMVKSPEVKPKINTEGLTIEKKAIDIYGETNNPLEAGFITTDGKRIDTSGKKMGGSPGGRNIDHREVASDALPDSYIGIDGSDALIKYQEITKNLRVDAQGPYVNIDISNMPNDAQMSSLSRLVRGKDGINLDITDPITGRVKKHGEFNNLGQMRRFIEENKQIREEANKKLPKQKKKI